jgi:deazaflavin-dependent oxidoreductase (nitroreductase family)
MSEPAPAFLKPTPIERLLNGMVGVLVGWGLGFSYNYLLQVQGRRSGRIYSMPVNVLDLNGRRFVVATRGETQWVRNARSSGQVWLKKGRRREEYRLRTVSDNEKPVILKAYLDHFRATAQRFFPVASGSPLGAFPPIANRYPAFELAPHSVRRSTT